MTFGIERLLADLKGLGYLSVQQMTAGGMHFAAIPDFEIEGGAFNGRVVGLAVPAANDYPRSFPCAMHIKAAPVLYAASIPGKVNILVSPLGGEWQYWSFRFLLSTKSPTTDLVAKINDIFRKC
jgi:hypothetical protein